MYDEIFRENGYHRSKRVRYELTLKSQRNVIHGGNLTWKFSVKSSKMALVSSYNLQNVELF